MVHEAEFFAEQDKAVRERLDAKKQMEDYMNSIKSSVDEGLKDKLSLEDLVTIEDAI